MHGQYVRPGITAPASIKFRNENELIEKARILRNITSRLSCKKKSNYIWHMWRNIRFSMTRFDLQDILGDSERAMTVTKTMTDMDVVERLKDFFENEARSCSMGYGCVTLL